MAGLRYDLVIHNGTVLEPAGPVRGWLAVDGERLAASGQGRPPEARARLDARGGIVAPGFVDLHCHGAGGVDVLTASEADLLALARLLPRFGVTAFCPTLPSASHEALLTALGRISRARAVTRAGARLLGVHLEGPYLNPARQGAQDPAALRPPSRHELEILLAAAGGPAEGLALVTLAPELPGMAELIPWLCRAGVRVAIGHSDATYRQVRQAVRLGATHVVHCFNAMRGLHHREPGVAGAALVLDQLTVEVIADGIHLHPAVVDLVVRARGPAGVALVTDATAAAGLGDGRYRLGDRPVVVSGGVARTVAGVLAGSTLTMDRAVRNARRYARVDWAAAVQMAATTPARVLGMEDRAGCLAPGRPADVVVLDRWGRVRATLVGGALVYSNGVQAP